jgi:hypothetical protein
MGWSSGQRVLEGGRQGGQDACTVVWERFRFPPPMGPLGRRPASGESASQTLRAPSTPHLPTSHIYIRTTDKQYRRQTRTKSGPNQLAEIPRVTSWGLDRLSPAAELSEAYPPGDSSFSPPVPGVLQTCRCQQCVRPNFWALRSLGLFSGWLESRLHIMHRQAVKKVIEVVGGAGILRSGLPPSEWRAATQGFSRAIRHNNVPVHRGPRGYIRSLSHALMLTLRYTTYIIILEGPPSTLLLVWWGPKSPSRSMLLR